MTLSALARRRVRALGLRARTTLFPSVRPYPRSLS